MDKNFDLRIEDELDDEEMVLTPPYYNVTYVDDYNRTHMALIKDSTYVHFLQDRFYVKDCVYISEQNLTE